MIAPDITLSPSASRKLMIRAFFDKTTCKAGSGPRSEDERNWQRLLTEVDSDLYLRWDWTEHQYLVLHDYHGLVTVAWNFNAGGFGHAYQNIKHKATLDGRKLREMLKAQREAEEQEITNKIADAGAEAGSDMHKAAKCRTTTDSVDEFKQVAVGEKGRKGIRII